MKLLKESIVYYSPPFIEFLKWSINNNISKMLLDIHGKNIEDDITFIDLSKELDMVSFDRIDNVIKHLKDEYSKYDINVEDKLKEYNPDFVDRTYKSTLYNGDGVWNSKSRNTIKIGRLVRKLLSKNNLKDTDIEIFVDLYKTYNNNETYRIELKGGTEIYQYYKSESIFIRDYTKANNKLSQSCMINKPYKYFQIYMNNPEVCNQLVVLNSNNKLIARCLIWKINEKINGSSLYVDQIYNSDPKSLSMIKDYIKNNNILSYNKNGIVLPNGGIIHKKMSVSLKESKFTIYPYMDTFKRLDGNTLYNDVNIEKHGIILDSMDGHHRICRPKLTNKIKKFFEF